MINQAIIAGNLGGDPEIRYTSSGTQVATLSIATTKRIKKQSGEKTEQTTWHRIVLWNKLAELASKYLAKGSPVLVQGELETNKWEDESGNTRYSTQIVGRELKFLGKK